MPRVRSPRRGSLQFWPRKRAKAILARVRTWAQQNAGVLGFAGYKVGMTHILINDTRPTSLTKNDDLVLPCTVLECPPLKVCGIAFYKKSGYGLKKAFQILAPSEKDLAKRQPLPKKTKSVDTSGFEQYDDIKLLVQTQPKLTSTGQKIPELFEIALGGSLQEKAAKAKELLGKDIKASDVFKEGSSVDVHAITKGKGYQGPVKRFGLALRHHKSEKTKRGPGSLGPWHGPRTWRVAHAGQTGFHTRTEYNKTIMKISEKPEEVNPKGGFLRYGGIKNQFLLLKGSIPGPSKRLIKITMPMRLVKPEFKEAPSIAYISKTSRQ